MVDASDNFPTKFLCNDAAVATRRPLVHAGVMRFGGQMLTVVPGESACLRCLIAEIPPREDSPGAAQVGILGAAAGVVGSWQAVEAVKLLAGIAPPPRREAPDRRHPHGRGVAPPVPRDRSCPACGDRPRITDPLSPAEYIQERGCAA